MKNYTFKQSILIIPVIINTVIFLLLSILHFYWAFGGALWYDDVLPTSSNGLHRMNPSTTATIIIALALLLLALITAGSQGSFDKYIKRTYFRYGALIIAIIFLLRAIGDFRFIGFFKTVKWTRFGINDTQFFSPLCLFVSLLSVLIFIFNRAVKFPKW
ncbi:MAG: hypothetical protein JWQ09_1834 [Segetibacter sp.]|nr:hypothetical protein [Segetibacter sp.]